MWRRQRLVDAHSKPATSGSARRVQNSTMSGASGQRRRAVHAIVQCAGLMPPGTMHTERRREKGNVVLRNVSVCRRPQLLRYLCQLGRFVSWMLGNSARRNGCRRKLRRSHHRSLGAKQLVTSGSGSGHAAGVTWAAGYGNTRKVNSLTFHGSGWTTTRPSSHPGYGAKDMRVAFAHARNAESLSTHVHASIQIPNVRTGVLCDTECVCQVSGNAQA
mmetsp:Transcript_72721/g.144481  ORF Transcript_72721/g.144481 Transcript_72721/m.144481 type:complete len:217 (-) Transcript_72721:31-681(-)